MIAIPSTHDGEFTHGRRVYSLDAARRGQTSAVWALSAGLLGVAWTVSTSPPLALVSAIIICFLIAGVTHVACTRSVRSTIAVVAIITIGSWAAEYLGLTFGLPFGTYVYAERLGPAVLGVPILVPLAWTMIAYPAIVLARRISTDRVRGALAAGLVLAAWDLVLDPLMVKEGYWVWSALGPAVAGVPISNFFGWMATGATLAFWVWPWLAVSPGTPPTDDRVPVALYGGSVILMAAKCLTVGMPGIALSGLMAAGILIRCGMSRPQGDERELCGERPPHLHPHQPGRRRYPSGLRLGRRAAGGRAPARSTRHARAAAG